MKLILFLIAFPIVLFMLNSCGEATSEIDPKTARNKSESPNKDCKIKQMTFEFGESTRELKFVYKEGKLSTVETLENGVNLNQTMVFNFHAQGGIQTFLSGAVIASYIYNDAHKVLKIKGEKGLSTRTLEYNSQGQVTKQITLNNDVIYIVHEYEYNNLGQPAKVSVYDNVGDLAEINLLKYDDKINPLRNTGEAVNNMEKIFGYPVGNQEHNVIEINKIYKKKTPYTVNGKFMEEGDIEINEIEYTYNAKGYPTELVRMRNGRRMVMRLAYTCD